MVAKQIAIAVALCVLISGCGFPVRTSHTVNNYEVVATEIGRGDCFYVPEIKSWMAIDDHHLYVEAAGSAVADSGAHYLVTTKSMCRGILYSAIIDFPNPVGLVCQNESRVAYSYGELRKSCGIDNIEIVENKEAAIALFSSRTTVEEKYLIDVILRRDNAIE